MRDAVIHRPGQQRTEQQDRTEVAIGAQVRDRPQFHADQHGMLERAPDIAAAIGRDHESAVEQGIFGTPTFVFESGNTAFVKAFIPPLLAE